MLRVLGIAFLLEAKKSVVHMYLESPNLSAQVLKIYVLCPLNLSKLFEAVRVPIQVLCWSPS